MQHAVEGVELLGSVERQHPVAGPLLDQQGLGRTVLGFAHAVAPLPCRAPPPVRRSMAPRPPQAGPLLTVGQPIGYLLPPEKAASTLVGDRGEEWLRVWWVSLRRIAPRSAKPRSEERRVGKECR